LNIQSKENQYLSEKVATNKDNLSSYLSEKHIQVFGNLDQDKDYISRITEDFITNNINEKKSQQSDKTDDFDLSSITNGITDNASNIDLNLEIPNNNISNINISLDSQSTNLQIDGNQFNLF